MADQLLLFDSAIDAAALDRAVATALEPLGYRPASGGDAALELAIGSFDELLAIAAAMPRTVAERIARALLSAVPEVAIVELSTLFKDTGSAWGCRIDADGATELDADTALQELLDEWVAEADDNRIYADDTPELVLAEITGALLDVEGEFLLERSLFFASSVPSRLRPLLASIDAGAAFEWIDVSGRPAIRIAGPDGVLVSAVDEDERRALAEILDRRA